MVSSAPTTQAAQTSLLDLNLRPETTDLQWTSVPLSEVLATNQRLEASVYSAEGKRARELLTRLPWPLRPLNGPGGIATVFHRPRFKRIFMEHSTIPIFQPSQVTDIKPRPLLFISDKTGTDLEALKVKKGQVLLTCSGTVGIAALVSDSYDGQVFSHDLLRIDPKDNDDSGYIYAFLKSNLGSTLVKTNNYGAVIQHIEPEHLEDLQIPYPPKALRQKIGKLMSESFRLRDKSNYCIDKATRLLCAELGLPPLRDLLANTSSIDAHSVRAAKLHGRLEATYHHTKVDTIIDHLRRSAARLLQVGDAEISTKIVLPGRFKRVYVGSDQGVVFFGGKQIFELDPSNKKYLSLLHHGARIKEQLTLKENTVLVTCSGTIGRVQLTPRHWEGWTANQHILRIIPASEHIAGYLYVWLQSEYGEALIKRNAYGAVVDELDAEQMSDVPVPLLANKEKQSLINKLALDANTLRFQAYKLERRANDMLDSEVLNKV